jgi:hypothetical protein
MMRCHSRKAATLVIEYAVVSARRKLFAMSFLRDFNTLLTQLSGWGLGTAAICVIRRSIGRLDDFALRSPYAPRRSDGWRR